MRELPRRSVATLIAALLVFAGISMGAPPAVAAVTCNYNITNRELLITSTGEQETITIARTAGGTFRVSGSPGGPTNSDCATAGTPARVTNVETVVFNASGGGSNSQTVIIDMTNGRFEPGVGGPSEAGGVAEIEFQIDLGNDTSGLPFRDFLTVRGTQGDDVIRFGMIAGDPVVNLNNDNDADVTFADDAMGSSVERFRVFGQDGNDTLTAQGGTGAGTPIIAAHRMDQINGGAGDDILEGGGALTDRVHYLGAPGPVTVDLAITTPQDTGWGIDTIDFVEDVLGSNNDDVLKGNDLDNTLEAQGGDDLLLYSPGEDSYVGDDDNDTVDFSDFADGISSTISSDPLDICIDAETTAGPDTQFVCFSTENLIGTELADSITGNQEINVIDGRGGDDTIIGGNGNDRIIPGEGDDSVSGDSGAGNVETSDTIDFSGAAAGITVDLTTTAEQDTGQGLDTIKEIENVIGSPHDDTLIRGSGSTNNLNGGAGNDTIDGAPGNDTLIGGPGNDTFDGGGFTGLGDTVDYSSGGSAVSVDLDAGTATSVTEGDDTLLVGTIQNVKGSAFNDTIKGDDGRNTLDGMGGDDLIQGRMGDDSLTGGAGTDTASYETANATVNVNLMTGTASGGDGTETLSGFENITGSPFGDTLTGDGNPNLLRGLAGIDMIDAGGGIDFLSGGLGNDTLNGGDGSDMVDYLEATGGVTVDLAAAAPQSSGADGNDTISNVENIQGSNFSDALLGNAGANLITGVLGGDTEDGRAGNDVFFQMNVINGGDTITGGEGNDTVDYSLRSGPVFVTQDGQPNDGEAGEGDNITEVENILRTAVSSQYLPEGATHSGFTTFVLLTNPDPDDDALVSLTFLTPNGPFSPTSVQGLSVPASSRRTVNVNQALGSPADVATKVESFEVPVSAEVAMHKAGSLAAMNMSATSETSTSWLLPEGATHSGFTTFVTIANPSEVTDTHVDIDFLTPVGAQEGPRGLLVPAGGRTTVNVNTECECAEDVSTRITVLASEPPVVAGLSMHKQSGDLAIGGSLGVTAAATTWVVAEGATHSGWATFVLVANPDTSPATVTVTYLTGSQGSVIDPENVTVPPESRRTISVNARLAALGLAPDDVSTLISATSGSVAVESTIQKQDSSGFVIADSVGSGGSNLNAVTGIGWVAPEGATHSGFATFILIANPTNQAAEVVLTFLTPGGNAISGPTVNIAAGKRATVSVNNFVQGQDVSTLVEATVGRVVVEMAIDRVTGQGFSKGRTLAAKIA